jgi:hypothetical protein
MFATPYLDLLHKLRRYGWLPLCPKLSRKILVDALESFKHIFI